MKLCPFLRKKRSNEFLIDINGIVINKIIEYKDFKRFISGLQIESETYIVKPNWSNAYSYTSAKMLEMLFHFLSDKKIMVIESYTAWRNEFNTGPEPVKVITPKNAKKKRKWIKEQDEWFLDYSGIREILEKYGVEYLNITEEVWSGRTANAKKIQKIVESRFKPIKREELYGYIPIKLYKLRGSLLISLNNSRKTREIVSLSIKNLFGLIPDPARYGKYHGEDDNSLPQSIIDINKIYRTLFNTLWINEIKKANLLIGGKKSIEVDAITAYKLEIDPQKIPYLTLAAKVFGGYNRTLYNNVIS